MTDLDVVGDVTLLAYDALLAEGGVPADMDAVPDRRTISKLDAILDQRSWMNPDAQTVASTGSTMLAATRTVSDTPTWTQ